MFDLKNISDADIVYVTCFHDSLISIEQDGCSVAIYMWCLGRKARRDQAVQTEISYVHTWRIGTIVNEDFGVVCGDELARKGGERERARRGDVRPLPQAQPYDLCEYTRMGPFGLRP